MIEMHLLSTCSTRCLPADDLPMNEQLHSLALFAADQKPPGFLQMLVVMFPWLLILYVGVMIFGAPRRKSEQRRKEAIKNLKKNDRIVTIGGITGTVANNISQDDKFITIKVEGDMKIKMLKSSIQGLLEEESKTTSEEK